MKSKGMKKEEQEPEEALPTVEPVEGIIVDRALVPTDDLFGATYPNINRLLQPRYRGREMTRQPGRISIYIEGSDYVVLLSCPSEKAVFPFYTSTMLGVWEDFEEALATGKVRQKPLKDWKKKVALPTIDDLVK